MQTVRLFLMDHLNGTNARLNAILKIEPYKQSFITSINTYFLLSLNTIQPICYTIEITIFFKRIKRHLMGIRK
jgi:hypothetical protein